MTHRLAWLGLFASLVYAGDAQAWKPLKPPPEGWRGELAVGIQATRGNAHSTSLSGDNEFSYRGERWESEFEINFLRTSALKVTDRIDANGEPMQGDDGEPILTTRTDRINDRRVLSFQPLYFFTERLYVFTRFDHEANRPAGLRYSNRSIGGFGLRLVHDKHNRLDAELGLGQRRHRRADSETIHETIGYVGLSYARDLDDRARFKSTLESDFGNEDAYTELELSLSVKMTERLSLQIVHSTRTDRNKSEPNNPLSSKLDSQFVLQVGVDVL